MANVKCRGNKEIDLLAINPKTNEKYHVEARVTTTGFKITEHDHYVAKGKSKGQSHRIGLPYFHKEKFEHPTMKQRVREVFGDVPYHKVLVVWDTQDNFAEIPTIAEREYGIEIMGLREMIHEFTHKRITSGSRDDVLRVLELVSLVEHEEKAFLKRFDRLGERQHGTSQNQT